MQNRVERKLILEDGSEYLGYGFGSLEEKKLEIVFNTSVVGYQEIISDPSYTYQGVVMTYPLIGNYGLNDDDYETVTPTISGLIVREYNEEPSNFRACNTLSEIMEKYGIVGIEGIDTRKLARDIRNVGCMKAMICDPNLSVEDGVAALKAWSVPTDAVSKVSTKEIYVSKATDIQRFHIVAIDCGMKANIVRSLNRRGCKVTVVPWNTPAEDILAYKPDGVFISNGPGDPTDVGPTIETIRSLKGRLPIFGICLGHQIISLAYGCETYKLKFGHRGGNHPVKNLFTDKVEITSQNHSYAVKDASVEGTGLTVSHMNLLDQTIEGVVCESDRVFSVQYHPESAPGPQDSAYLFDAFIRLMEGGKIYA